MNINQVKDLLSEINFYEKSGKYRLADEILNKLTKIAYNANISDIGSGVGDAFKNKFQFQLFNDLVRSVPECLNLFSIDPNAQAYITPDYKDCIQQQIQSGVSFETASLNCQTSMLAGSPQMDIDKNKQYIDACMSKVLHLANNTATPSAPSAKTRQSVPM